MDPPTSDHLSKILNELGIEIIQFKESTATSRMAADAIGCELGQIAKSLAFLIKGTPILVVASGDQRVDDRKLAALYEVGRKKVKIAKPEQCLEIYGYAPGSVPPFGHHTPNIPISVQQLIEVTGGTIVDVKRD